jgi:hypothetical protein
LRVSDIKVIGLENIRERHGPEWFIKPDFESFFKELDNGLIEQRVDGGLKADLVAVVTLDHLDQTNENAFETSREVVVKVEHPPVAANAIERTWDIPLGLKLIRDRSSKDSGITKQMPIQSLIQLCGSFRECHQQEQRLSP